MKLIDLLNEEQLLLLESGIRIPPGTESFKILHHDDADGIGSARLIRNQIQEQMFKKFKKKYPKKSDKEIKKLIDKRIVTDTVTDSSKPNEVERKLKKDPNQMIIVVDFDRFDKFGDKVKELIKNKAINFHSDHHQTDNPTSVGGGKTGATEYRSDTEHINDKYLSKKIDPKTILKFSNVDSATFEDKLERELGLEPQTDKHKKMTRELFLILNSITRSRKNPEAMDYFIKNSGDTLYSMYNTAKKLKEIINLQSKGVKEINKKNPDMKLVDNIRKELVDKGFKDFALKIKKGERVGDIPSVEDIDNKNKKDLENSKKLFKEVNKYIIMSEGKGRNNPSRYLGFAVPNKDKEKYNALIRTFPSIKFTQMALSPDAPQELKDNIDMVKIMKDGLVRLKERFGTRYNDWAFNIIDENIGGHKGIGNAGSFGTLGILPKRHREILKKVKPVVDRINNIKILKDPKKMEEFLKRNPELRNKVDYYNDIQKSRAKYSAEAEKLLKIYNDIIAGLFKMEADKILNGYYRTGKEKRKKKNTIKEEMLDYIK